MTAAERVADQIRNALPRVKSGTLRFWGQWLGRPHDNSHAVVSSEAAGECLRVAFNEGETLSVWSPRGATIDEKTFRIDDAERVRWEWFPYGRPKTPRDLCFEDFTRKGSTIAVSTNAAWYRPNVRPDPVQPAVEIV